MSEHRCPLCGFRGDPLRRPVSLAPSHLNTAPHFVCERCSHRDYLNQFDPRNQEPNSPQPQEQTDD